MSTYSWFKNPVKYWNILSLEMTRYYKNILLSLLYWRRCLTQILILQLFFSNFSYHVVVLHCIFKICILFSFPFPILNQILVLSILNWICLFWNDKLLWPPTLCCCWWVQEILCGFFHHSQHHPSICILFFECCTFFPATHQNCKDGSEHFFFHFAQLF